MLKKINVLKSFVLIIVFLSAHGTADSATSTTPATSVDAIPTLDQILDPSVVWGVNLDLVHKRQIAMRQKGDANDFSTKIVLFQSNKTNTKKLIDERVALIQKTREIEAKALKKKDKEDALKPIRQRISEIDGKLAKYKEINRKLINNIISLTGLSPEQVSRLPPYERAPSNP